MRTINVNLGGQVFTCSPRKTVEPNELEYVLDLCDNDVVYDVRRNGELVGKIRSHDGPGLRDGNMRWFDWFNVDGELINWTDSLRSCVWENCR